MKKIVAINGSPRTNFNTATLIHEAAEGAREAGAEVQAFDLYRLEKYSGCVSCFGCKLDANKGRCVIKDALAPVLETIRSADGLILGTPNYLSEVSAGFRALYERLVFQSLTYQAENRCCNTHKIPVLFIMTSNAPKEIYERMGYDEMLKRYENTLTAFVGDTKIYVADNTLQVKNYDRFNWTQFDVETKKKRHEEVFPLERQEVFALGKELVDKPW